MKITRLAFAALTVLPMAALADTPINETHPLNADAKLSVQNVRGLIRVTGSQRNDVQITGTIGEGAKGLIVEGDAGNLSIRVDYPESHGWSFFGGGQVADSSLILEVPAGIELDLGSVSAKVEVSALSGRRIEIETVSGDVQLGAASPTVEIDGVSGDLVLELEGSRDVDLQTVSGDIELRGSLSDELKVETVSGNAEVSLPESTLAKVKASTVSGDLHFETGVAERGRFSVESLSGDVRLQMPSSTSATLHVESFSGDIRSDAGTVEEEEAGPGSSLDATLGGGSGRVEIESFSGDVHVQTK